MKRCKLCVMPDTRPGIKFNEEGVCLPCVRHAERKSIDWNKRREELKALLDAHRKTDGSPDVIIASSGGKDSTYQEHILRHVYKMNPIMVTVCDWFGHTKVGQQNFANASRLSSVFTFTQAKAVMRLMVRRAFEHLGSPTWPIDAAIYNTPIRMSKMLQIPLICYGENIAYTYGGPNAVDELFATRQKDNDVVKPLSKEWWLEQGVSERDWWDVAEPTAEEMAYAKPFYLGYAYPWDGYRNKCVSEVLGFKTADGEWDRKGCCENYDQIDSYGYMIHPWLKMVKYGHARVTDICSNLIRNGYMKRDRAIELVNELEGQVDPAALEDFLQFTGYTKDEFWRICAKFADKNIVERRYTMSLQGDSGGYYIKEKAK